MIEVIGEEGSSEYSTAISIRDALVKLWPRLDKSPASEEHVRIASDVKISGYRVSDIDVVVSGIFKKPRRFVPRKIIHDMKGGQVVKRPVTVKNFMIAVEVKDHDEDYVKITGDKISVKYSRCAKTGWKSATDQNINQVHSLVHYFKDLGQDLFVHRCVIMRGLYRLRVNGAVAGDFDGVDFLTAISSVSKVMKSSQGYVLTSGADLEVVQAIGAPIFKTIRPTSLDRQRMDMIATSTKEIDELLENLGKKMVHLRGHGGSGKTVMLLQMAWKAFENKGLRTIVLTYNHALAADIRRLLALLKVPSNPEDGGIMVITVMSFMYSWFKKLQLIEDEDDLSYKNYDDNCKAALEMLNAGAITSKDVDEILRADPDRFDFDCIVVDEAQDWPQAEVELLKAIYSSRNIALADGIDQLLRGVRSNWELGISESERLLIPLTRCLRMKRNLSIFNNQVAHVSNVKWEVRPNNKAAGGKILILKNSYTQNVLLHEKLIRKAKEKGNAELDFLFCVPPSDVSNFNGKKESGLGRFLLNSGYVIWDGVDESIRKDFPRSLEQFRIVQYASCRGLEGWTVVLHQADKYWDSCKEVRKSQGLSGEEELAFEDIDELSSREAWLKFLIALTRPIDTLVIDLDDINSEFSQQILRVAKKFPDIVEVID